MKVGGTYTIEGKEGWFCSVCDSHLSFNINDDMEILLMRSGEVPIDECWLCKRAYEDLQASGAFDDHILDTTITIEAFESNEGGVE